MDVELNIAAVEFEHCRCRIKHCQCRIWTWSVSNSNLVDVELNIVDIEFEHCGCGYCSRYRQRDLAQLSGLRVERNRHDDNTACYVRGLVSVRAQRATLNAPNIDTRDYLCAGSH